MTDAEGKRIVLAAIVIAAAGAAAARVRLGQPVGPPLALATALSLIILTLLAEVAPQLAAGLAVVLAMSTWLAGPQSAAALARLASVAGGAVRRSGPNLADPGNPQSGGLVPGGGTTASRPPSSSPLQGGLVP